MVEVYRTIDERREELRETTEELRTLAEAEETAYRAYKAAEQVWREAKKAASGVRDRRNAQIRGLAGDVAAGRVKHQELANDVGVVHQHLKRLLSDEPPLSEPEQ